MEFVYFLTLYIFSEVFELLTQKGNSFKEIFSNLLKVYERGILRFLLRNPTFYVVLLAMIYFNNFSFIAILLMTFKLFDLIVKIVVCERVVNNKPLGVFMSLFEPEAYISDILKIGIILIYITLFCISFSVYA